MSNFGTVTMCTTAIGVNTVYHIRKGHDPFNSILAGSIFMGACVLIGGLEESVGTALAAVFLLSIILGRGEELFTFLSDLVNGNEAA